MRRSTRNFVLFAAPLTLCALGLSLWLLWTRESAITEENIARIQQGMTRAEVEAILGGPARDETDGRGFHNYMDGDMVEANNPNEWMGDKCVVSVYFVDGRVAGTRVGWTVFNQESLLDRVRRWLRL